MGLEVAAIGALVGGGLNIFQQQQQASAEQDVLKQQEAMARQQANEAEAQANRIAESEEVQGIETARRQRLQDKKRLESKRAFMAGSGVSQTEGSPLQIEEQEQITSALNSNDIFNAGLTRGAESRFAGQQQKRGLLFEAEQFKFQRKASKQKAKSQMITGLVNTAFGAYGAQKGASSGGFSPKASGIGASSGKGPSLNKPIGFGTTGF